MPSAKENTHKGKNKPSKKEKQTYLKTMEKSETNDVKKKIV